VKSTRASGLRGRESDRNAGSEPLGAGTGVGADQRGGG
jgi:hypothetical protein